MLLVLWLFKLTVKALKWVFTDAPLIEETEDEWITRQMW